MKLHILTENQEPVENFKKIIISSNTIATSEISDNECSFILANDALDSFSVENVEKFVQEVTKKLRINGTMVVGGTDIRLFCKYVTNGMINEPDASKIIDSKQSMTTLNETVNLIGSLGLAIESTQIRGIHYEVKAKRG